MKCPATLATVLHGIGSALFISITFIAMLLFSLFHNFLTTDEEGGQS